MHSQFAPIHKVGACIKEVCHRLTNNPIRASLKSDQIRITLCKSIVYFLFLFYFVFYFYIHVGLGESNRQCRLHSVCTNERSGCVARRHTPQALILPNECVTKSDQVRVNLFKSVFCLLAGLGKGKRQCRLQSVCTSADRVGGCAEEVCHSYRPCQANLRCAA